ncbi:probable serine/threonine-protein kinase DDB_G0282963 isoform X2 [Eupeodes corollae]|uniref:probable serine/threonine-protein kinase DDB_G0282963 isoform X2 n=1 Tax=Eupeodes corollae TaxID=290404 RepID=UPI0024932FB8|nr:probable serine/threonine-protein kinase DDB_G0282963 isoform X2 [Eupeodes corollae]
MRINQSPHWRALALLGALLSVIIVWPTVLSMPMLTTRTPTTTTTTKTTNITNTSITEEQHPSFKTSYSKLTSTNSTNINLEAAQNNTFIDINHKQINDFSEYSNFDSYLLHLNVNTSTSDSSEDQYQDQYDDYKNQDINIDEHLTHSRADIDPLYAIMTDGNVSNSRRVKKSKSNMVYNKRKRKKNNINDSNKNNEKVSANEDVSNTTYLSSASISDYDSSTTVINSLSQTYNNDSNNNINSVSESDVLNSDEVMASSASSIINHHYQSKRTRNLNKSDIDDNGDVASTTIRYYYTPTTTSTDGLDVTSSNFSNLDEQPLNLNDNSDTYVTSTSTSLNVIESRTTKTLTHTELPVLSRTDRSVHIMKQGSLSLRHRSSNTSRNNASVKSIDAAEEGVSIKPRRLNNHNNKIHNFRNNNTTNSNSSNLDRNERSTILEDISGPGRKIQLYIKNRFIQLMTDGTVNGTMNDLSEYTILQRTTVDVGRIKIQSVATCLYLCMDQCGAVYGSKEFTDDCVFNESMEQHNYNTYSSTYNSNSRRIYYLALNRHGEPRKLQIPPSRPLGKLATYTKAITGTVPQDRVETVIAKIFGKNRVKHGIRQLCDTGKPIVELTDKILKARPQCPATNSNSNSNSNNNNSNSNSNKNGQLNVPAANDKSSNSSLTNSSSNSNSSSSGHTSGNSNNNHVIKKKKKKRRCRPGENEDEHNCQRGGGPQAMKKRPNNNNNNKNNRLAKCKELAADAAAALECANQKRPKKGGKKQQNGGGPKHKQNGGQGPQGRRGGKKLNQNGRQQQGGSNSNKKNNGKQPKNGFSGGERITQLTTTTIHPIINEKMVRTPRSRPSPSTLKLTTSPTTTTPTPTTSTTSTSTTTTLATLLQVANKDQQSFVSHNQLSSSQVSTINQTSTEIQDDNNSESDDTTAEEETGTGEAEAEEEDLATAEDDDTSSHLPFIGEHTQLVGGADDFLYDDDLDFA